MSESREFAEFEYADQKWSVPVKMSFAEMEAMQDGGLSDVVIVRTLLDAEQLKRFRDLDLDEDQVDEFTDAMAKAKKLGSKGNSSPSAASS